MGRFQEGALVEGDKVGLSPQILALRPHHKGMVRDMIAGGLRPGQLAKLYGMSPSQISVICGSPAFQAEKRRLEELADLCSVDRSDELKVMAQCAMDNLKDDLTTDVETPQERKVRQNASLEVLGLAGVRKKDRPITTVNIQDNRTQVQINEMSDDDLRDEVAMLAEPDGEAG